MNPISTGDVCSFLGTVYQGGEIHSESRNWFLVDDNHSKTVVYVSQSKPSAFGKANWYYEFFNEVVNSTLEKIADRNSVLFLIDYVHRRYVKLTEEDVGWASENSSRVRKKKGLVTDFVIRKSDEMFYLCPILSGTGLFREVEVLKFP